MRKITLYIIALFITTSAWAQIPNASFENWSKDSSESLDKWILQGGASKTMNSNSGKAAISLLHQAYSGSQAIVAYGAPGLGGWPYTGRPDTISFFAKGKFAAGDSGQVVVSFGNNGSPLAFAMSNFSTNDSVNFIEIKIPITFVVPVLKSDTIGIYFLVGQVDSLNSWAIVDDIKLTKDGATEGAISNPGFETWNVMTTDKLTGWTTSNDIAKIFGLPIVLIDKTTDAKDGSAAMKLTNKDMPGMGSVLVGAAFSGNLDINGGGDSVPTFAVNKRFLNLTGYYKYAPVNGDTCQFRIILYKGGAEVGHGEFYSSATTNSYTMFNAPVKYDGSFTGIPDSASIILFAGSENGNPQAGSVLYIDQLELNDVSGIANPENNIQTGIFLTLPITI